MIAKILIIISVFIMSAYAAPINNILVLVPMVSEFKAFSAFSLANKTSIEGADAITFSVKNKKITIATIGIGAVNAAMLSTLLINKINPDLVIISGVAGGLQRHIKIGDVVLATKVFSVHFGGYTLSGPKFKDGAPVNPIKRIQQPLIYPTQTDLFFNNIDKNVHIGAVATTQNWPNNPKIITLLHSNNVFAIAMEDAAVGQVCWVFNKPLIVVRGISDNPLLNVNYDQLNVKKAAKSAADVVMKIIESL